MTRGRLNFLVGFFGFGTTADGFATARGRSYGRGHDRRLGLRLGLRSLTFRVSGLLELVERPAQTLGKIHHLVGPKQQKPDCDDQQNIFHSAHVQLLGKSGVIVGTRPS